MPTDLTDHEGADDVITRDEGRVLGLIGGAGYGLGAIGGPVIWISAPETINANSVALVTTSVSAIMAVVCLLLPWHRMSASGLLLAPVPGVLLIAAAIWNMVGGGEMYEVFYLYIALGTAYVLPRAQLFALLASVSIAAALPLAYDPPPDIGVGLVHWVFLSAGAAAFALLLQGSRRRLREFADRAEALSMYDELTGVGNRRAFEARTRDELARAHRLGHPFAVLAIDLDGFKLVNDRLGHAAGDHVLHRVAGAMSAVLRDIDPVARLGGDEFAVLITEAETPEADQVAKRLINAIESVAAAEPGADQLSASIGRALYPDDGETFEELMRIADARLYMSKRERQLAAA